MCSPAQVRGEHVEHLLLTDDWMERRPVGSIDHVALVRGPPVQRADAHTHQITSENYFCFFYQF